MQQALCPLTLPSIPNLFMFILSCCFLSPLSFLCICHNSVFYFYEILNILFTHVCLHGCVCGHMHITEDLWRSEDNLGDSVLSFHHVDFQGLNLDCQFCWQKLLSDEPPYPSWINYFKTFYINTSIGF